MDQGHSKLLDKFSCELKTTLNLRCLFPCLRDKQLLTSEEQQQLRKLLESAQEDDQPEDQEQNATVRFLKILKTKGSKVFQLFLETLKDEKEHLGHNDLYETLSQAVDKRMRQDFQAKSYCSSSVLESGGSDNKKSDYPQQMNNCSSDFSARYRSQSSLQSSESSAGYHSSFTPTDSQREYHDIKSTSYK